MRSDPSRTADVAGKPFYESVSGRRLLLDDRNAVGAARGVGELKFAANEGLGGEALPERLPAIVTWKEAMDFDGKGGAVSFLGDVNFHIGQDWDYVKCKRKLRLIFEHLPQTQPSVSKSLRRRRLLGGAEDASRKVAMVVATKDVVVCSPVRDARGNLQGRILLTAERQFIYDARHDQMSVYGPGDFTAEDYRAPKPQKLTDKSPDSGLPERVERPWQTMFQWEKSMSFWRSKGTVVLEGNVRMRHLSGRQMVATEGIQHEPWPKLPEGRSTELRCKTLEAKFPVSQQGGEASAKSLSVREELELGALDRFVALGDVRVEDGVDEVVVIHCQKLEYDKKLEIFRLIGSLPGRPPAPAMVQRKLPGEAKPQVTYGKELIYNLQTQRVTIKEAYGGGLR